MDISHHLVACIPTNFNEIYGSIMTALLLYLALSNNIINISLNVTYNPIVYLLVISNWWVDRWMGDE